MKPYGNLGNETLGDMLAYERLRLGPVNGTLYEAFAHMRPNGHGVQLQAG